MSTHERVSNTNSHAYYSLITHRSYLISSLSTFTHMPPTKSTQHAIQIARSEFAHSVQKHLLEEHDLKIGQFEAEELFEKAFQKIAPLLYNQALADAKDFFLERFSDLADDIVQIEIAAPKTK